MTYILLLGGPNNGQYARVEEEPALETELDIDGTVYTVVDWGTPENEKVGVFDVGDLIKEEDNG